MSILGFGIKGYKNFCGEIQYVGPFTKLNIFIGKNNSGKSNILSFIQKHLFNAIQITSKRGARIELEDEEIPQIRSSNDFIFALPVENSEAYINEIVGKFKLPNIGMQQEVSTFLQKVFKSNSLMKNTNLSWFRFETTIQKQINELKFSKGFIQEIADDKDIDRNKWLRIFSILFNVRGGALEQHWIPDILTKFINEAYPKENKPEAVYLLPAIRRVEKNNGSNQGWDFGGKGLIDRLAILQNPNFPHLDDQKKFFKINGFLKNITGNKTAEISIPHDRETILVKIDEKTLPLSSLGTGIHEVIILAATATTFENKIICIEEPELHLHPFLQQKLINYLNNETSNQYFITTHSASFINTTGASIFHVSLINNQAVVELAISNNEKFEICKDLGYQASDLLQTNCIIWVEGPSDRIYINHWIKTKSPDLLEGLHYSIMFYGGRLLSHLSIDEDQIEKFISLKKLNRNISIVMDSDKKSEEDKIRDTVLRIQSEFENSQGITWITEGKEIENYLSSDVLFKSINNIDSNIENIIDPTKFGNVLSYIRKDKTEKIIVDKVKLAYEATNFEADYSILDLDEKINKLIDFIKQSNNDL